jgi:hypothetical protein
MTGDPLRSALAELARRLQPAAIELIVGGGYGLLLRAEQLARTGRAPRYGFTPKFRSTSDLDCFLGVEIITDADKMKAIATALTELGYKPVEPYWTFERKVADRDDSVHIDLLAADVPENLAHLVRSRDGRRIRPKAFGELHARKTREAVTVARDGERVDVSEDERASTS